MELGFLVQFASEGTVTTASGVQRKVVNSFVYGLPDRDLSFTTKAHLGANFLTNVWAPLAAQLSTAWVGQHLWVGYPNTPGDVLFDAGPPASGSNGGNRLSLNQCAFCNLHTPSRTRPFTGCKRFGPVAVGDVTGEELTGAAVAAWQTSCNHMTTPIVQFEGHEAIVLQPVVWSRLLSLADTTVPPAVGDIIVSVHVNRTLGQWRHRRERTNR